MYHLYLKCVKTNLMYKLNPTLEAKIDTFLLMQWSSEQHKTMTTWIVLLANILYISVSTIENSVLLLLRMATPSKNSCKKSCLYMGQFLVSTASL